MKISLKMILGILLIAIIPASCVMQEKVSCPDFSKDKSMSYKTAKKYSKRHNKRSNLSYTIAWLRYRNNLITPEKIDFPHIHEITNDPIPLTEMLKVSTAISQDSDNTLKTYNNEMTSGNTIPGDHDLLNPSKDFTNVNSQNDTKLSYPKNLMTALMKSDLQDTVKPFGKKTQPGIDSSNKNNRSSFWIWLLPVLAFIGLFTNTLFSSLMFLMALLIAILYQFYFRKRNKKRENIKKSQRIILRILIGISIATSICTILFFIFLALVLI